VLSNGHASMSLYSLLHLTRYDPPIDQIKKFRQMGSITPGHEIIGHTTYTLVSDEDLQEGVASEAASLAGTLGLDKFICIYDDTEISIEGDTHLSFREDVAARFRAYGWEVIGPVDGNDISGITDALEVAQATYGKPKLIVVKTTIGFGAPNKAGSASAHGEALGVEELAATREALGWGYGSFEIPPEVTSHMRKAPERGAQAQAEWNDRFTAYEAACPKDAAALKRDLSGELPDDWDAGLDALLEDWRIRSPHERCPAERWLF